MNRRLLLANMKKNRRSLAARALRDERGLAAVEFALILPLMLTMYLGMDSLNQRIMAVHKIEQAATTLANLAAAKVSGGAGLGQAAVTDTDITSLFNTVALLMRPYPASGLHIDLYEVSITMPTDSSGYRANAVWRANQNGEDFLRCDAGAQLTAPDDLPSALMPTTPTGMTGARYLMVAQIKYDYTSPFAAGLFNWVGFATTFTRRGYAENRNTYDPPHVENKASTMARNCNFTPS